MQRQVKSLTQEELALLAQVWNQDELDEYVSENDPRIINNLHKEAADIKLIQAYTKLEYSWFNISNLAR